MSISAETELHARGLFPPDEVPEVLEIVGWYDNEQAEEVHRAVLALSKGDMEGLRSGTRNDTLNRAAFSLGQLVAIGLLSAAAVMSALADAAAVCGLPSGEADRTIRSGMSSGIRQPRAKRPGQLLARAHGLATPAPVRTSPGFSGCP